MSSEVHKLLILIKRRPGTTLEAFRDYYEKNHVRFGIDAAAISSMCHYSRRYLEPISGGEFDYDVLTECWFRDREKFDALVKAFAAGQFAPEVVADEARFMDRSKIRFFTVTECQTAL